MPSFELFFIACLKDQKKFVIFGWQPVSPEIALRESFKFNNRNILLFFLLNAFNGVFTFN